jgi:cytochrome c5
VKPGRPARLILHKEERIMRKPAAIALGLACLIIGASGAVPTAGPEQVQMPMRGMMHRMIPDLVPPGVEPQDLPDPDGRGARLLVRYCGQCHNLPSPAMHSSSEWPAISERMFYRMEMMSGMMGIESPSATAFRATCSQCHALPDPRSHTAAEWPAVVEKMRANMRLMRKKIPGPEQEKEILSFLEKNAKKE